MGKQSSRLFFNGKDHKDIYFNGHYHKAMYLGNQLVWEKINDIAWNSEVVVVGNGVLNSGNTKSFRWHGDFNGDPVAGFFIGTAGMDTTPKSVRCLVYPLENGSSDCMMTGAVFSSAGDGGAGLYGSDGVPAITIHTVASTRITTIAFMQIDRGFKYPNSDFSAYDLKLRSYCNATLGWMMLFDDSLCYKYNFNGDPGKKVMGVKTVIYVDGELFDYSSVNLLQYYGNERLTIIFCDGIVYKAKEVNKWITVQKFPDFDYHRVANYRGKIIIGDSTGKYLIDEDGESYELTYSVSGKLVKMFSRDESVYFSFSNGDLIKTDDLKTFHRKNIGRVVWGCKGNCFLSEPTSTFKGVNMPVYDWAIIDF